MRANLTRRIIEDNLGSLGLRLPKLTPRSLGTYAVVRLDGDVAQSSALGPFTTEGPERFSHVGELGTDLDEADGRAAAAVVALNLMAALDQTPGVTSW